MEVLLALIAALMFALGTVVQQREAMEVPDDEAMRAGLLLRLARRPIWLAGILADALGFVAQAVALGIGRMVVVQPLLATMVVFALPLGARLTRQRVGPRQIAAAVAVAAGLAAFLVLADPQGGRDDASISQWLLVGGPLVAVSGLLALAGAGRGPGGKATLFGIAAGILFGLSAALTKATVDRLDDGVVEVVIDWHVYALAAVGFVSMTLSQISLQAGALGPAVATQSIFDPVASLVLGIWLLDEQIHDTALGVIGSGLGLVATFVGLVILAMSPAAEKPQPSDPG
jgi:drug/metabolite transporter (DMT)-like permease